jgi:hypothetical protein
MTVQRPSINGEAHIGQVLRQYMPAGHGSLEVKRQAMPSSAAQAPSCSTVAPMAWASQREASVAYSVLQTGMYDEQGVHGAQTSASGQPRRS